MASDGTLAHHDTINNVEGLNSFLERNPSSLFNTVSSVRSLPASSSFFTSATPKAKTSASVCLLEGTVTTAKQTVKTFLRNGTKESQADPRDTYAELTVGSIDKLLKCIQSHVPLGRDDVIVNGGAGYNFMAAHIVQSIPGSVFGIEYNPYKAFIGTAKMIQALESKTLTNTCIGYIAKDMKSLNSLGLATFATFLTRYSLTT